MLHWSLLSGVFPTVLIVLAIVAANYLMVRSNWRRWWTVIVPSVLVGAAGLAIGIDWYVNDVWQAFTDPLPNEVVIWFGVIIAAVALLVLVLIKAGWRRRILAVVATAVIVAQALNGINQYYGYYPTMADALGQTAAHQIALPSIQHKANPGGTTTDPAAPGAPGIDPPATTAGTATGLQNWRATGPLPKQGAISEVTIPNTPSVFRPRPAWVYLPPAYLTRKRPDLPVLMLIPGQFSSSRTWIVAGKVVTTMDAFAAKHHGIAPIVVMPDALGTATGKQMCLDTKLGDVESYLAVDVVRWVRTHLQVDTNTAHWAVGGFSYGGSCSLVLAVSHPTLFPTFLDISGEITPTLNTLSLTVKDAFGGSLRAYQAVQPLRILAAGEKNPRTAARWRRSEGIFVVGAADRKYIGERKVVMAACRKAGMRVRDFTEPGSHSWYVAESALIRALPDLAARMGLT